MEEKEKKKLDIMAVAKLLFSKKKSFIIGFLIALVLSCLWILPKPRTYTCTVSLAPESGNSEAGGSLGSIASSFGFNLGNMASGDAIYPVLYPDIVSSSDFLVSLFDVKVKTLDGSVDTDYYTYMTQHQQVFIYMVPVNWVKRKIRELKPKDETAAYSNGKEGVDPFFLSEREDNLVESLRSTITCAVDLKTEVISITVIDQDRLVCATMADSVRVRLQKYITDYRTSKARVDAEYYKKLMDDAQAEYDASVKAYSDYCDSHQNVLLQAYVSERDKLELEMQTKQTAYNAFNTQYQAALAKIQQSTPAFTVIQGATVPQLPSGPKRMLFIAGMIFLTILGIAVYHLRKYIF
ncbi:MAG: chain-length determining protein [Prevotellaceae bacterium]|nr:chain-length determining protein [Candidatus Minthosoma caballi]